MIQLQDIGREGPPVRTEAHVRIISPKPIGRRPSASFLMLAKAEAFPSDWYKPFLFDIVIDI